MKNLLKTTIPAIILFIIYIYIWNVAENYFYSGKYNDYMFCISMAVIVTPIYYFVCMKVLGISFGREIDYMIQAGTFLSGVVLYSFLWPVEDYGYFQGFECIERLLRYSLMYLVGSAVYALVYYVVCSIRKRMYWDIIRRLASSILIFMVYSYLSEGILPTISGIFVLVVTTEICHLISMRILRVTYEKLSDYIFELSVLVCVKLLRNIIFDLDFYDELFGIIGISILYAFANGINYAIDYVVTNSQKSDGRGKVQDEQYEKEDIRDDPKLHKQHDLKKAVLENMKSFLLDSGNDFLLIDEEYHLQAEKDVYYPDLLLYHMKLQCLVALNLKTDDFKPEYLDKMNAYLETLDRDFKKPTDNPSMGIFLCKNEETEVVEYCLNKSLSQEMAGEYEAKLIDKKILKEKLGELYDRATKPIGNELP